MISQEGVADMLYSVGAIHGEQVRDATAAMIDMMVLTTKALAYGAPHMERHEYVEIFDQSALVLGLLYAKATPTLSSAQRDEVIQIASRIIVSKTIPKT